MKFVRIGNNYINLDNVALVQFSGKQEELEAHIYFNASEARPASQSNSPFQKMRVISNSTIDALAEKVLEGDEAVAFKKYLDGNPGLDSIS